MSQEQLKHKTATREDGACPDVATDSFWGCNRQRTLLMSEFSTQSLQHPISTMPSTEWAREEDSIWWMGERSRAWHILPPCLFNLWRNGTHCHCGIPKDCLPHCWEAAAALQLFSLRCMLSFSLWPAISHHVPQRCTLIHSSSNWTIRDWRAHQPDLLIELNLPPTLAKWNCITLSNSILPLIACCA